MIINHLSLPCTILSRVTSGASDAYGDEIRTEVEADTFCELQHRGSQEGDDQVAGTSWLLILPAETEIDQDDGVLVEDVLYEVDGEPWKVRNPRTSVVSHIEARLIRTAGPDGAANA